MPFIVVFYTASTVRAVRGLSNRAFLDCTSSQPSRSVKRRACHALSSRRRAPLVIQRDWPWMQEVGGGARLCTRVTRPWVIRRLRRRVSWALVSTFSGWRCRTTLALDYPTWQTPHQALRCFR